MAIDSDIKESMRDVEVMAGDESKGQILLGEETTHRGIKSRHAQMLAIGKPSPFPSYNRLSKKSNRRHYWDRPVCRFWTSPPHSRACNALRRVHYHLNPCIWDDHCDGGNQQLYARYGLHHGVLRKPFRLTESRVRDGLVILVLLWYIDRV